MKVDTLNSRSASDHSSLDKQDRQKILLFMKSNKDNSTQLNKNPSLDSQEQYGNMQTRYESHYKLDHPSIAFKPFVQQDETSLLEQRLRTRMSAILSSKKRSLLPKVYLMPEPEQRTP